jgi:hypothetical protein
MADVSQGSLLAPQAMLAAACERTGLTDFGETTFREGFNLLLGEIEQLDLAPEIVADTAQQIGSFLDARLMAVAGWKAHPECLRTPVERPLIIAGLVRSGTTALHQLLSLDPQFQVPEHWLTVAPMPRPPREAWDDIPQYRAIAERMAAYVRAAPEMAEDHMMSAEGAEESLFILAQNFASNMFPSTWDVPHYQLWYEQRDDTDSYTWLADVLRLIGWRDPHRRWLLKNPTDLFSLNEVLNVFPNAMIVQTHRDPVAAIPSIASLIFAARRVFMGEKADPKRVGRREMHFWALALERAEQARTRAPGQVFDVEFSEFVADQLATVKAIYRHFGLTLTPGTEQAMQAWLDAHPRRAHSGNKYLPEFYGLDPKEIAKTYADYRARRGYD